MDMLSTTEPVQMTLEAARATGERGRRAVLDKAERLHEGFSVRAQLAILGHLCAVNQCAGETLTSIAQAKGAACHDARAFGSVFKGMQDRGYIECVRADLPRVHGRGATGGKLWAITAAGRAAFMAASA